MIDYTQIIYLILSYLIGAIPFGFFLTKIFTKKDIRHYGSRNIGATNVARVAGKKLGLITLILDGGKGAIMVILAQSLFQNFPNIELFTILVAISAVFGHIFPIYLKFKGGKGVATTLATLLALNLILGFLVCCIWLTIFLVFRISSLSSLSAVFSSIIISYFLHLSQAQIIFCIVIFAIILYRHKENISRLLSGKENKI